LEVFEIVFHCRFDEGVLTPLIPADNQEHPASVDEILSDLQIGSQEVRALAYAGPTVMCSLQNVSIVVARVDAWN